MRGFFQIGTYHAKTEHNVGTLWRSAQQLGAAGIFTVGARYKRQASDTNKTWRHIPLQNYKDFDDLLKHVPYSTPIVAVEFGGEPLNHFWHPERCVYLLGAEDNGLPPDVINRCHLHASIESVSFMSYNVAVAGSIVMYSRLLQQMKGE